MSNQIFDNFNRSEFSDEIYSIFGRALTVATRFDASTKVLARLPLFKVSAIVKHELSDDEYNDLVHKISSRYKNLNRALESLEFDGDIEETLKEARESRNELIHETALGADYGFDYIDSDDLSQFLSQMKGLVLKVIKGDVIISTIISVLNKDAVSDYQFSEEYESKYASWVMERFES